MNRVATSAIGPHSNWLSWKRVRLSPRAYEAPAAASMMISRSGTQSMAVASPSSMASASMDGARATAAMMTANHTKLMLPRRPSGSISVRSRRTEDAGSCAW